MKDVWCMEHMDYGLTLWLCAVQVKVHKTLLEAAVLRHIASRMKFHLLKRFPLVH
jgi:hypothetical protein